MKKRETKRQMAKRSFQLSFLGQEIRDDGMGEKKKWAGFQEIYDEILQSRRRSLSGMTSELLGEEGNGLFSPQRKKGVEVLLFYYVHIWQTRCIFLLGSQEE